MDKSRIQFKALDKYLSPIDVWGISFGCMVGWGVFAMPGNTFVPVAGPTGTIIAMIIGMVIMLIIARNFSYLLGRTSVTGGIYSYTKEAFGRDHAFISSWFLCLSYLTIVFLNGTALFYVVRIVFNNTEHTGFHYTIAGNNIYVGEIIVSVLVLAGIAILFVAAKPLLQKMMTVCAVMLLAGILLTTVVCFPQAVSNGAFNSFGTEGYEKGYAVFSLVILAPWAFVGFEVTSFEAAHFRFQMKKSRMIILTSIVIAAFAYAAMAMVSVAAVPDGFGSWQEYFSALDGMTGVKSVPTFFAASSIMGTFGIVVMTITAICAILTGIIGGYRATTRVLSTMAEDQILSKKFAKTTYSIIFIMVLSIVLSLFGRNTLIWFVDLTSFGAIVGFGYTSAAAYKIAKTEGNHSIKITGMIGLALSVLFVVVQLIPRLSVMEAMGSEAFLMLSLWCLLGFVFYWRTVTRSSLTEYSGMSSSGVVLFARLLYSALMWIAKQLMQGETYEQMRQMLVRDGVIVLLIIFVGLAVMHYVQNVVRKKNEAVEREKIHAVESSLAKSQFLFNMSHDIRTPMNAIIGYTNLARKESDLEAIHGYLDKITGSSQHLLALINDILEMSRIESGKVDLEFVPVDLCSIFDGMRDLFSEQMKQKKMDFSVHTSQIQHRYAWCDRKNLNRVLLNILSNAYKFTPEGGTVKASLWEVSTDTDSGYGSYEIRVQDNGIGMSKEFAEKMFNSFERERTSTVSGIEGTGLGMSITKSIVDLMGGTIEVLTAPGSGTEIIIRLKFKLAEESDVPELERQSSLTKDISSSSSEKEAEVDFSTRSVLLVEDNAINMEIANMILTQAGFTVETAENGRIAVDMVREGGAGRYDVILMDIQMPEMDGYEATRAIRSMDNESLSGIPIVAMTANAFQEDVEAAEKAGMQGHIAKPVDVEVLMKTLTEVLLEAEKK